MSLANAKQILAGMYDQGERDFRGFGSQLKGADLSGIYLEGCNLSGLDLAGTNLAQANLSHANLTSVNLGFATLVGARLTRATMRNADLTCANVAKAEMRFCILAGANLCGANFWESQLEPSIFTDAAYNANTTFPDGFDRTTKGMARAAATPQHPRLSASASAASSPPTTLDSKIPPTLRGNNTVQARPASGKRASTAAPNPAKPPQSEEPPTEIRRQELDPTAQQPPTNPSERQGKQPDSKPKTQKVLFRGRWVEM